MTTITKYPTDYEDLDNMWTNEANFCGATEGNCANCLPYSAGTFRLRLKTFQFNLPAGAVLQHVYFNWKSIIEYARPYSDGFAQFKITIGANVYAVTVTNLLRDTSGKTCASSAWNKREDLLDYIPLTVEHLNNETFTVIVWLYTTEAWYTSLYGDVLSLEVEYTVPTVARAGLGSTYELLIASLYTAWKKKRKKRLYAAIAK